MADTAALSNSAITLALQQWVAAVDAQVATLEHFATSVLPPGASQSGAVKAAREAVRSATGTTAASSDATGTTASFAASLDAADAASEAAAAATTAALTLLDPNLRAVIIRDRSLTFADSVRALVGRAEAAATTAATAAADAMTAAAAYGATVTLPVADATAAYARRTVMPVVRSAVSTEMFLAALRCAGTADAAAALDAAKDSALGVATDSPEAVVRDAKTDIGPLLAMSYAPLAPVTTSTTPTTPLTNAVLNLAPPGAQLSVVYDPFPLIDRSRARAFGPLAEVTSGLNFKLVDRLRTIKATPISALGGATRPLRPPSYSAGARSDEKAGSAGELMTGAIAVTTDGKTVHTLVAPAATSWAPLAGTKPRQRRYAAASGSVIMASIAASPFHVPESGALKPTDGAGVELPPETVANAITDALKTALASLESTTIVASGTYVMPALLKLAERGLETWLQRELAAVNPRIPYRTLEREARLWQLAALTDPEQGAEMRIRQIVRKIPIGADESRLKDFRAALLVALGDETVVIVPPSPKLSPFNH